ncbi:peptidoglycan recognition protein [Streptomyces sp. NPDC051940]|uniref:peptidoglycan recognition protein family protein n=1 Tax=Streptomyces sp. NPDC051940 TaxID=3155675 RepID=UPI003444D1C4
MRPLTVSSIGACAAAAFASMVLYPTADHSPRTSLLAASAVDAAPGSTQSLPLLPLTGSDRSPDGGGAPGRDAAVGLPARDVRPFSLVGVVWRDPSAELHGTVQVRTRGRGEEEWSGWQDLTVHSEDAPDPGSAESTGAARGATAPLWVGDSDGVQVRVTPGLPGVGAGSAAGSATGSSAGSSARAVPAGLPSGLRVELVDPGAGPESEDRAVEADPAVEPAGVAPDAATLEAASVNAGLVTGDGTEIRALSKKASEAEAPQFNPGLTLAQRPFVGPRPYIVTRRGWGADERIRESGFRYTNTVKAAFVHHTATGNGYRCSESGAVLRSIYRYHVKSLGWADFGYNFAVDKCGKIYEGRAGGVTRAVLGAHTYGFNKNSMGVAVLGTYDKVSPSPAAVKAVARLTAWKLGLYGANPRATVTMVSGGGKYAAGAAIRMRVISGHRDGFSTDCPGARLYGELGVARVGSARLQGR